jgi:RNA polymerase sigma factor (sigma-70 family)
MAKSRPQTPWQTLESLFDVGALGGLSDGELLDCFENSRDTLGHDAFRILVGRHGPMVLAVCRSLLFDPHEADDAFQATFLILVKRAGSIKRRDTIGPWLHGVAGRVARRARGRSLRRQRREVEANAEIPCPARPIALSPSVDEIIHDEIARLPEAFRAPVVLCCLEGLSYDLAARRLGLKEPTLRGRLYRARRQLASRLRGRGITTGLFAVASEPVGFTLRPLPLSLAESTVQFAVRWSSVTGLLPADLIPTAIIGLAEGVLKTMLFQSLKLSAIVVLIAAGALGTVVVAQQGTTGAGGGGAAPTAKPAANAAEKPNPRHEQERASYIVNPVRDHVVFDEKNQQIEKQLDLLIDAEFPRGVRLDEFLKFIKQETSKARPPGIPIYVSPRGVWETQKQANPVVHVELKQQSIRQILVQALMREGLSFAVQDGFLMIDSRTGILEIQVKEIDQKLDRVLKILERLEKGK